MSIRLVMFAAIATAFTVAPALWYGDSGAVSVELVSASLSYTEYEITVPGLQVESVSAGGATWMALSLPGAYDEGGPDEGRPEVPEVSFLSAVPTGASVSVTTQVEEAETLALSPVFPLQASTEEDDSAEFMVDSAFYAQDTFYPFSNLSQSSTGMWRSVQVAQVAVFPVFVNPQDSSVILTTRLRVTLTHVGGAYPDSIEGWMAPIYGSTVPNLDLLPVATRANTGADTVVLIAAAAEFQGNASMKGLLSIPPAM